MRPRNDTLVLCYHALSDRWPADLSVRPAAFAAQLERLHARGYRGTTFTEAVGARSAGRRVAVTFDDAFASVLTLAKPVLDRLSWPATVFAVTSFADSGAPLSWEGIDQWQRTTHAHELQGLRWDRLRELADGGWEVGSHTLTHPRLTRLGDEDLRREVADSRDAVEDAMGRPCTSLAYPYGDCDDRVVAAAARAGYAAAGALPAHWGAPRPLNWPRAGVYHGDDLPRFTMKTSLAVRRARVALGR